MNLTNDEKYPPNNFKNDTLKNWRELKLHLELIEIIQFLFQLQLAIILFFPTFNISSNLFPQKKKSNLQ